MTYTEADIENCPVFQAYKWARLQRGIPRAEEDIAAKKAELLKRYNDPNTKTEFVPLVDEPKMWLRLKLKPYCLHVRIGDWEAWLHRGYWTNRPGLWWTAMVQPPWKRGSDEWGHLGDPPGYPTPAELIAELYTIRQDVLEAALEQLPEKYREGYTLWQRTIRIQDIEEPSYHQVYVWEAGWPQDVPWAITEWYDQKERRGADAPTLLDALKLAWKWIEHPNRKALRKMERKRETRKTRSEE
jgi:hypothetical protein